MTERALMSSREAVLSSLLFHACLVIVVLLFPGVFRPGEALHRPTQRPSPIPVAFQVQPDPPEKSDSFFGDSGKGASSEPRPASEPPARNSEPYARGNTPNRFLAPPSPLPPDPVEGMASRPASPESAPPAAAAGARAQTHTGDPDALVHQGEREPTPAHGSES